MKIFNTDGSVLMEISEVERAGNNLEFRGTVMGSMPVKGRITPGEVRNLFKLMKPRSKLFFLATLPFRKA